MIKVGAFLRSTVVSGYGACRLRRHTTNSGDHLNSSSSTLNNITIPSSSVSLHRRSASTLVHPSQSFTSLHGLPDPRLSDLYNNSSSRHQSNNNSSSSLGSGRLETSLFGQRQQQQRRSQIDLDCDDDGSDTAATSENMIHDSNSLDDARCAATKTETETADSASQAQTQVRLHPVTKAEKRLAKEADTVGNNLMLMIHNHKHVSSPEEQRFIEQMAWKAISELPDETMDWAGWDSCRMISKGWAYFARHWENGPEGPGEDVLLLGQQDQQFGGGGAVGGFSTAFPPVAYDFNETKGRMELRPGTGDLYARRLDPQEERPESDPLMTSTLEEDGTSSAPELRMEPDMMEGIDDDDGDGDSSSENIHDGDGDGDDTGAEATEHGGSVNSRWG